ncbi:hypothetical protein [Knoellia koreensis]|uniref:Uncharacterized protein n=1 Tax=Knoellia koreensis TaxID=2730921 RepID=A0A849HCI7_9MICO|nr:hypothetical protein [Knoellia sp. DB2414S]NNM44404.1 hypothetical protein [Knoellia sp. DB2414S]
MRNWLSSQGARVGATFIGEESQGKPGYDNVYCLVQLNDGRWMVAYFERGSYDDARYFTDEAAACLDFVQMVAPRRDVTEASRAWERFGGAQS